MAAIKQVIDRISRGKRKSVMGIIKAKSVFESAIFYRFGQAVYADATAYSIIISQ